MRRTGVEGKVSNRALVATEDIEQLAGAQIPEEHFEGVAAACADKVAAGLDCDGRQLHGLGCCERPEVLVPAAGTFRLPRVL